MSREASPAVTPSPEPGRWQRLKEVVADALELPDAERHPWLLARCADAPELRAEATAMLAAAAAAANFLEAGPTLPGSVARLQPGDRLGGYEVEVLLGEGGFSEVYRARQHEPIDRRVAIKLLKPGMDSRAILARFAAERRTLARLEHPGIARILDAGATPSGRPFLVMDFVDGPTLGQFLAREGPDRALRLALFLEVCDAVAHAHQRGVIHRDLKPANLLVRQDGGVAHAVVIDFGIAKVLDADPAPEAVTRTGVFLGTVDYCSPEQRAGDPGDVDVRADVHALGVVLAELVAGQRLVGDDGWPRHVPRELGWIVARATHRDRSQRYDGVADLARDLRAFLAGEPLRAAPPTRRYRLGRFVRRHRLLLAAAVLVAFALGGGAIAALVGYRQAERARLDAALARDEATATADYLARLLLAADPARQGRDVRVVDLLAQSGPLLQRADAVPTVAARLHHVVGEAYVALGDYGVGTTHLQHAVDRYRRVLGDRDWRTIEAECDLASVLLRAGRHDEVAPLLADVAARAAAVRGNRHSRAGKLCDMRAKLAFDRGRPAEAEAPLRELLALDQAEGRTDAVIATAGNLSQVLLGLRRTDEAQALARQAVDLARGRHGADHPLALAAARKLAAVHLQAGDHQAMVEELAPLLAPAERRLGPEHPDTMGLRLYYASGLQGLGRLTEAEPVFAALVDAQRRKLARLHPQAMMTLHNYGAVLTAVGNHAEAERVLRDAAARLAEARGADDEQAWRARYFLAGAIAAQGRHREVAADYAAAVDALQRVLPAADPLRVQARRAWLSHLQPLADEQVRGGDPIAAAGTWDTVERLARELQLPDVQQRAGAARAVLTR